MRVLVVEDDPDIASAVRILLVQQRYAVDIATNGDDGLDRLLGGTYALAIVDIGLPGRDGFAICSRARAEHISTPLLLLTARDAIEDRIHGLDSGADDYLTKPFAPGELVARVRALLRRGERAPIEKTIAIGSLELQCGARRASVAGVTLMLGATEFRILELLSINVGITLSRTQILEKIWDDDFQGSSNIVDVYVSQIRRKLKATKSSVTIDTIRGVGYRLAATASRAGPCSA